MNTGAYATSSVRVPGGRVGINLIDIPEQRIWSKSPVKSGKSVMLWPMAPPLGSLVIIMRSPSLAFIVEGRPLKLNPMEATPSTFSKGTMVLHFHTTALCGNWRLKESRLEGRRLGLLREYLALPRRLILRARDRRLLGAMGGRQKSVQLDGYDGAKQASND